MKGTLGGLNLISNWSKQLNVVGGLELEVAVDLLVLLGEGRKRGPNQN
jgi:hypothetical protein